jgi:hypothetical protein
MAPKRRNTAAAGPKKAPKNNKTTSQRGLAHYVRKDATPVKPVESLPEIKVEVAAIDKRHETNERNKVARSIRTKVTKFEAAVKKQYKDADTIVPDEILELLKTVTKRKHSPDQDLSKAFKKLRLFFPQAFEEEKLDQHEDYLFAADETTRLQHIHQEILKTKKASIHTTSKSATAPTKVDHSPKLVSGDYEFLNYNLRPAVEGAPLPLCMIVKSVPNTIVHNVLHHYGSLGGYTKAFETEAKTIHISKKDELMLAAYDDEFGRIGAGGADPALWALIVDSTNQTEKRLGERGIYQGCAETENQLSAAEQAAVKALAKAAKTKKKGGGGNIEPKELFPGVDSFEEKTAVGWQRIADFYAKQENKVDPVWLHKFRTSYMMDAWSTLAPPEPKEGEVPRDVSPSDLRKAKVTTADSKLFDRNEYGRLGPIMLRELIADCLREALGMIDSTGGMVDSTVEPTVEPGALEEDPNPEENPNPNKEVIDFKFKDFKDGNLPYYLDTGVIKQGKKPVHQGLHLDNVEIMDWKITKKILLGELNTVTPEEWLKCGYVMDMPLSEEGAWIRVAIPDPVTKVFRIEWVFVPLGCFLLRSQALYHSGHYGGPGNTRYHGTFSVQGAVVESSNLGHFHRLEELGGFEGWKLQWNPNIPRTARAADGYVQLTNPILKAWKILGTKYYKKHISYQVANPVSKMVMANLNIYKLLPPPPRKGLPKDDRTFDDGENDVVEKQESVENSNRIPPLFEVQGGQPNDDNKVDYQGSAII